MAGVKPRVKAKVVNTDGECALCGATKNLTVDHVIPKFWGGSNRQTNLITLCQPCNVIKGHRLPSEREMAYFARLIARRLGGAT